MKQLNKVLSIILVIILIVGILPMTQMSEMIAPLSLKANALETTYYAVWTKNAATVASGACGNNLNWTLDGNNILTIMGSGDMDNYSKGGYMQCGDAPYSYSPWYDYKDISIKVVINSGVTSIGRLAFADMTIESISIPSTVTSIGDYAFRFCKKMADVSISANVNSIGYQCFNNCANLQNIVVNAGNTNYSSSQGILYNKDKTTLIICPAGTLMSDVTVPGTVKSMAHNAFEDCVNIQTISFPDSLERLDYHQFDGCKIKQFNIGKNLNYIDQTVFYSCNDTDPAESNR